MKLVAIGNSKGIRLSKSIITKYHLDDGFFLKEEEDQLIIVPEKKNKREGWAEYLAKHQDQINLDIDTDWLDADLEKGE
ncbi:AbrB/MazE/SpoVT family DNA-binding domain-containing protein [Thiotrichales bacterium 19S11-10]|nr:AbrB/MazE/SpoVT family DNA-binding domain-containing protein [Thiotrichales bacterium 19S11-10]